MHETRINVNYFPINLIIYSATFHRIPKIKGSQEPYFFIQNAASHHITFKLFMIPYKTQIPIILLLLRTV